MEHQNRTILLNILWELQDKHGHIRDEDVKNVAHQLGTSEIDIEGVISFYHFFSRQPRGKYTIYLNNSILSEFAGFARAKETFEQQTGAKMGSVDPTGQFGLFETALSDFRTRNQLH